MKDEITFVNFRKEHGLELIQLWRKSFAQALGIKEDTREEEVNEHLAYLQTYNPGIIRVALEKNKNKIVGFMAKEENTIKDLFIHVEFQRKGLGSRFINQAKAEEEFLTLMNREGFDLSPIGRLVERKPTAGHESNKDTNQAYVSIDVAN